jgi:hypothetical protein
MKFAVYVENLSKNMNTVVEIVVVKQVVLL